MSISSNPRFAGPFLGNGTATSFAFEFDIFDKTSIQVVKVDAVGVTSTLALDADYSVTVNVDQVNTPGGSITYPLSGSPLATGETLSILGAVPYGQPLVLPSGGPFRAKTIEQSGLDVLAVQIQQLLEMLVRAVTLPPSDVGGGVVLPSRTLRANSLWGFDENGDFALAGPVSGSSADLALQLAATTGPGMLGYDPTIAFIANTLGWGLRINSPRIPAMKYLPPAKWAGLAAGTETGDMSVYLQQAIDEAASQGGIVEAPGWTMCHTATLTWSARGVAFIGTNIKDGNTASAPSGTCLKWTGAVGGRQMQVTSGAHQARVEHVMFDSNDKANAGLIFLVAGGSSQQIHMPSARHLRFNGYRGYALVFGNPDLTVLEAGQLQMASLHHISWDGGGATATVANVAGLVLNAQNCETLNCSSLYFDPYTVPFGGPNINHQSHIIVKTGGLGLRGCVMTRADGYDIDIVGECGLVIDHVRTEDPLFLRTASGFASNPVSVTNVQGRDGTSTGTETFMSIACGGGQSVTVENVHTSGHITFLGANNNVARVRGISYMHPGVSVVSVSGAFDPSSIYDIEATPGIRTLYSPTPDEIWKDLSGNTLYRNKAGVQRIKGLAATGAAQDPKNFTGANVTVFETATTGTFNFGVNEPDANYDVYPGMPILAGGPAAGASTILGVVKSTTGFTFTVAAAPGTAASGKSVTFPWLIVRH